MAVDIFSLVLSGASSWAIGRVLDSVVGCGSCGSTMARAVPNVSTSKLVCARCSSWLDQYTNATPHTVASNGAIASAFVSNVRWESWGGMWETRFNPHYDVDVVNSKYEDLVIRLQLSAFQGSVFYSTDRVLRPASERSSWRDCWWKIGNDVWPKGRLTYAVEFVTLNTWGDELHRTRSLGTRNGG